MVIVIKLLNCWNYYQAQSKITFLTTNYTNCTNFKKLFIRVIRAISGSIYLILKVL